MSKIRIVEITLACLIIFSYFIPFIGINVLGKQSVAILNIVFDPNYSSELGDMIGFLSIPIIASCIAIIVNSAKYPFVSFLTGISVVFGIAPITGSRLYSFGGEPGAGLILMAFAGVMLLLSGLIHGCWYYKKNWIFLTCIVGIAVIPPLFNQNMLLLTLTMTSTLFPIMGITILISFLVNRKNRDKTTETKTTSEVLSAAIPHAVAEEIERPQSINTPEKVLQNEMPAVSKPSVVTSEPEAIIVSKSTITEDAEKHSTYQPKEPDSPVAETSKTNNMALISILAGVLLVLGGALTYFLWYVPYAKDRDALRTYVVANSVFLRSSQQGGVEYNIIERAFYGSEVITYSKNGEWAEVKTNGQEGFISSAYLLDTSDFNILNNVWGDSDAKECIESSKCRLAVLDYHKNNRLQTGANGWQIYTRMKDQKPNTVFYPRIYNKNSKFTDFVFITKNVQEGGKRIIVCYSFDDETEKPIFRFSAWGPTEGYIQNILPTRDGVSIVFDNGTRTKVAIE